MSHTLLGHYWVTCVDRNATYNQQGDAVSRPAGTSGKLYLPPQLSQRQASAHIRRTSYQQTVKSCAMPSLMAGAIIKETFEKRLAICTLPDPRIPMLI